MVATRRGTGIRARVGLGETDSSEPEFEFDQRISW